MPRPTDTPATERQAALAALLHTMARLLEQLRLGRELPADPWEPTRPQVRPAGDE